MLEVGRVHGSVAWNRAHFGAWIVVSAPLILGLRLTRENLEPIVEFITNPEVLAVNQGWYGHPGFCAPVNRTMNASKYVWAVKCDGSTRQEGWTFDHGSGELHAPGGGCVDVSNPHTAVIATCHNSPSDVFKYDGTAMHLLNGKECLDVWDWAGPRVDLYRCNSGSNQRFVFGPNGTYLFIIMWECMYVCM